MCSFPSNVVMSDKLQGLAVPGDRLGSVSDYIAGSGTYIRNGFIYSKLCGNVVAKKEIEDKLVLEVIRNKLQNIVPEVNSIATCKVISNNTRLCKVFILSVNGVSLHGKFIGIIRKEDVRATEKDKVKMYESFCPGDVIVARILSLGDSQSYYLTTAENELGVIYASSIHGHAMVPVDWCTMQCTVTGLKENRKVAKVKVRQL
nr:exosome complex component CSL4 isoform X2 [Hydra vulgaris]